MSPQKAVQVEDYEPFIGPKTIDRIRKKAKMLKDLLNDLLTLYILNKRADSP